jgi:hypothetical protein
MGVDASDLEGRPLRTAYRRLAREHHPDLPENVNRHAEATRDLQDLNGAYDILSNPDQLQHDYFEDLFRQGFDNYEEAFAGAEQQRQQDGPRGFQMGSFARPHEAREAAMAQRHYAQTGPPPAGVGMPFVVGGEHLPRHPTPEAVLPPPRGPGGGREGALERAPGYVVLFVPPDLTDAFMRCQSGRGTDEDWAAFGEWCAEQGLERLYLDIRAMNRRQVGGGFRPRGYLNPRGRRAGNPMTTRRRAALLKKLGYEKARFVVTKGTVLWIHPATRAKVTIPLRGTGDEMFMVLGGPYGFTSSFLFIENTSGRAAQQLDEWRDGPIPDIPPFPEPDSSGTARLYGGWVDDLFIALAHANSKAKGSANRGRRVPLFIGRE